MAAGPLLVASQTRRPAPGRRRHAGPAAAVAALGLYAGALADRLDRRWSMIVANTVRGLVLAGLCAVDRHRARQHRLVLVAMLRAGHGRGLRRRHRRARSRRCWSRRRDLGIANARLMAGFDHRQPARRPGRRGAAVRGRDGVAVRRARSSASRLGVVLVSRIGTPPRRRPRARSTPTSARTSPRACAG